MHRPAKEGKTKNVLELSYYLTIPRMVSTRLQWWILDLVEKKVMGTLKQGYQLFKFRCSCWMVVVLLCAFLDLFADLRALFFSCLNIFAFVFNGGAWLVSNMFQCLGLWLLHHRCKPRKIGMAAFALHSWIKLQHGLKCLAWQSMYRSLTFACAFLLLEFRCVLPHFTMLISKQRLS